MFHVVSSHVCVTRSVNSFFKAHSVFESEIEALITYRRLIYYLHSSLVEIPEILYISFFVQGVDFTHCFMWEDKSETCLTRMLFSCLTSVRFSFIVLSDSLYCSSCSFSSLSSLSFLWYWAIRILSFIDIFIGFFKKK